MSIDWTKIYKKYKGLWVALKDDHVTVISSGKNLEKTMEAARKKGFSTPFVTKVPEKVLPFVGKINS